MKIWRCPQCNHGVRAPERLRATATARYCLKCSAKSDTLIERVCPSKEAERAKREAEKEAAKAKAKEKQAAKRAEYALTERGILEGYCAKWTSLDAYKEGAAWADGRPFVMYTVRLAAPRKPFGVIDIASRKENPDGSVTYGEAEHKPVRRTYSTGHAYGKDRFVITAGSDHADALTTILHEIAHLSAGYKGGAHGDGWRSVFASAVREVTGQAPSGVTHFNLHTDALRCVREWLTQTQIVPTVKP